MTDDSAPLGYAKSSIFHESDEPTPMSEALVALRTAPPAERDAFWAALRDSLSTTTPRLEAERKADMAARRARPDGLVYYILFADRVKIGYTTNLERRLDNLPHDEVLATEPGTMTDERARHKTFANLRVTGEWFRYEEPLVSHIAGLQ